MNKHIFWTLASRLLLIAAGLASSIVTARLLGPEGRGTFFYWSTLGAVVIQFGNLGLHSSNTYFLAKGRASLAALAANSLWVSVGGGALLGAGLALVLAFKGHALHAEWRLILPTLLLIPGGLYFLLGTNLLVALGHIGEYNAFEVGNRILGLIAVVIAAWRWPSPESVLAAVSLSGAIVCWPLRLRLKKLGGHSGPDFGLIREGFGYALRAYLASAIGFLVLRLNTLILKEHATDAILGTWSIAAQLLDLINVVPAAIALVLFPRIMRAADPYRLMKSQLRMVAIALTLICVAAAALGHQLIGLVYGGRFSDAYTMMLWGLPGAFSLGLISILSQYLAAEGMPTSLIRIWLGGLAVEAILAEWLVPRLGGEGAMASLSMTYFVTLVSIAWLAIRFERAKAPIASSKAAT